MFDGIYKGKKVLVTGGCGFKGSWLAAWLIKLGATVKIISHAPRTNPSHFNLLKNIGVFDDDIVIGSDLNNFTDTSLQIKSFNPDLIFHLAAKAIVYKTFSEPRLTIGNNIIATLNLLESVRNINNNKLDSNIKGIVCITTDKVYDNKEWNYAYRENDTLGGLDPYSASKVCVEHIINCYRSQFFPMIATARAGNVIGGGDWSEKRLIPDIVRSAVSGQKVEIHTPNATRPWQHVLEALHGYLLLGKKMLEGDQSCATHFNFGPIGELTVEQIVEIAAQRWDKVSYKIKEEETHPSMVELLKIDSSNAIKKLGWKPKLQTWEAISSTISWYKNYYEFREVSTLKDISMFEKEIEGGLHGSSGGNHE